MLKQFAKRHNLVLKRGQNVYILFTLTINYLMMAKLHLYKFVKGIKRPIVHYYALCWNEEKMLPFMFDYYDQFVDHYTIYDNYSTDRSEEIILSHKNAEIVKFSMNGEINDFIYQKIKNNCWKKSRGKADYVVVCDMDEFIYYPWMTDFLTEAMKSNQSIFHPHGYDMYCEKYPIFEKPLLSQVQYGVSKEAYSKCILFSPNHIVEINYELGAHKCVPLGIVRSTNNELLKLLHFKNLGLDYILGRIGQYRERQSDTNKENHCAVHYQYSNDKIRDEFLKNIQKAEKII